MEYGRRSLSSGSVMNGEETHRRCEQNFDEIACRIIPESSPIRATAILSALRAR